MSKCKCRSVSVQRIFRKNPSQCFREKDLTKPESMSSIKAIDASVLEGRLEGEGEKRGQTRMKEESERAEQGKNKERQKERKRESRG